MPKGVFVRRNRNPPKRRKPNTKPDYKGKRVATKGLVNCRVQTRVMGAAEAAKQIGRQKGGLKTQMLGTGHRWDVEGARKAAQEHWRRKRVARGVRIGMRSNRRPAVKRAPLRAYYAEHPTQGISYVPEVSEWVRDGCPISERTALIKLGHLRSSSGYVPAQITQEFPGIKRAGTEGKQ